jgi:hypothetical protein
VFLQMVGYRKVFVPQERLGGSHASDGWGVGCVRVWSGKVSYFAQACH